MINAECDSCGRELREGDQIVIYDDSWFCSYECLHNYVDEDSKEWVIEAGYQI